MFLTEYPRASRLTTLLLASMDQRGIEKLVFSIFSCKVSIKCPVQYSWFSDSCTRPLVGSPENDNKLVFSVEHRESMFLLNVFVVSHKPTIVTVYMTRLVVLYVSWNFMYCGTSCIVAFMCHGIPCLVELHASCKSRFTQENFEFYMWIFVCNHTWIFTHVWSYSWAIL